MLVSIRSKKFKVPETQFLLWKNPFLGTWKYFWPDRWLGYVCKVVLFLNNIQIMQAYITSIKFILKLWSRRLCDYDVAYRVKYCCRVTIIRCPIVKWMFSKFSSSSKFSLLRNIVISIYFSDLYNFVVCSNMFPYHIFNVGNRSKSIKFSFKESKLILYVFQL